MAGIAEIRDIGAFIATKFGDFVSITAGGGGDGAEVTGPWVDTLGFGSMAEALTFETTLAETETLSLAATIQDADDASGTNASDYKSNDFGEVATGGSGGTTEQGSVELDADLSDAKRYVRVKFTPTMSAASADTADVMATHVMGGPTEAPA